jgi:haloacid dehalogenase superfamily, subfamily IA, variant 3 with third motif having DD or ED
MVNNIVFDLGGVLVGLNRVRCLDNFKKIGFSDFENTLSEYHQGGYFLDYEKGTISSEEFREIIRGGAVRPLADDEIDSALVSFLENIPKYKIDLLLSLREKGYSIYLLSNSNEICIREVRDFFIGYGLDFDTFFVKKFLSYEMKMAKPDPEVFLKVLEEARIEAEETLFVDDYRPNIESALAIGFKVLLYNVNENLAERIEEALEFFPKIES